MLKNIKITSKIVFICAIILFKKCLIKLIQEELRMNKKGILIVILSITLATTFVVSTTFAKYVSELDKISDSARVAKWDIGVTKGEKDSEGNLIYVDLFQESYLDGAVVSSETGKKVVAPGTSGIYKFTLTGAPETAYRLSISVDSKTTFNDIDRIVFTFDGEVVGTKGTLSELVKELNSVFNSGNVYAPNTSINRTFSIGWEWPFEEGIDEDTKQSNNKIDTALGEAASLGVDVPKVELAIDIIAEQVESL